MKHLFFYPSIAMSPVIEIALAKSIELDGQISYVKFTPTSICRSQYNPSADPILHAYTLARQHSFLSNLISEMGCRPLIIKYSQINLFSGVLEKSHLERIHASVMSSIASLTRSRSLDSLSPFWQVLYKRLVTQSIQYLRFLLYHLDNSSITDVHLFNGRFFDALPARLAAEITGINYHVSDVKYSRSFYSFTNVSLHSIEANHTKMIAHAELRPDLLSLSEQYFYDRRFGKRTYEKAFTSGQTRGYKGSCYRLDSKHIISIFPSSDDEYRYLASDWNIPTVNQADEIYLLANSLIDLPYHIVVRMHPNMAGCPTSDLSDFYSLSRLPNVTVLKPESPEDTYAVMDIASICVVFCSSMAIECNYWRKPLILIGPSPYIKTNLGSFCQNGLEASALISSHRVTLGERQLSLKWASYLLYYNDHLPRFIASDGSYSVKGCKVLTYSLLRFLCLPSKILLNLHKPQIAKKPSNSIRYMINGLKRVLLGKWSDV